MSLLNWAKNNTEWDRWHLGRMFLTEEWWLSLLVLLCSFLDWKKNCSFFDLFFFRLLSTLFARRSSFWSTRCVYVCVEVMVFQIQQLMAKYAVFHLRIVGWWWLLFFFVIFVVACECFFAAVDVDCVGGYCGTVAYNFFCITDLRTCRALDTLKWINETQLELSVYCHCLIFSPPSFFLLAAQACFWINSSVVLLVGALGLQSAYSLRSIRFSAFFPNFAISESRILTSCLPGSFLIDVWLSVLITDEPGANDSYSPLRLFFCLLLFKIYCANFSDRETSVRGTEMPASVCWINRNSWDGSILSLLFVSCVNYFAFSRIGCRFFLHPPIFLLGWACPVKKFPDLIIDLKFDHKLKYFDMVL